MVVHRHRVEPIVIHTKFRLIIMAPIVMGNECRIILLLLLYVGPQGQCHHLHQGAWHWIPRYSVSAEVWHDPHNTEVTSPRSCQPPPPDQYVFLSLQIWISLTTTCVQILLKIYWIFLFLLNIFTFLSYKFDLYYVA